MEPPFPLHGHQAQVGASVGVTVSQAADVDAVLREADVAMYTAKAHGKGRFELATTSVLCHLVTVGAGGPGGPAA